MTITLLPTPVPTREDPANFSNRADAFLAALPTFAVEANETAAEINADAAAVASAIGTATSASAAAVAASSSASTSASTASTAAGTATAASTKASQWAEKTDGQVEPDGYSAKYWALIAQAHTISGAINDTATENITTWSSLKINNTFAKISGTDNIVITKAGSASIQLTSAGYDSAYLFSDSVSWGLYSNSGGSIVNYQRSTGKTFVGGVDTSNIVKNDGGSYGINITGSSASAATASNANLLDGFDSSELLSWNNHTNKPTTLAGYGLPDAVKNDGGSYNIAALKLSGSPGSAPHYSCRAWVHFDGVTMSIYGSGNVSSITDNGSGNYIVNFTTAMQDTNYTVAASASRDIPNGNLAYAAIKGPSSILTTSIGIGTGWEGASGGGDTARVFVSIFR